MNYETAENALSRWLSTSTGYVVRIAHQEAPSPAEADGTVIPYCSLLLVSQGDAGFNSVRTSEVDPDAPSTSDLVLSHSKSKVLTVRVQAFSPKSTGAAWAMPALETAATALSLESVRAPLYAVGLGLQRIGVVTNLTAIAGTLWQGRASLEVTFNTVATAQERTGYVSEVAASLTFT